MQFILEYYIPNADAGGVPPGRTQATGTLLHLITQGSGSLEVSDDAATGNERVARQAAIVVVTQKDNGEP